VAPESIRRALAEVVGTARAGLLRANLTAFDQGREAVVEAIPATASI
jgi:hypothetical protein